jgi:hypothetical protein
LRSTVEAIESIGVMPDPAAMHRCRPGRSSLAANDPLGVCTSITSPGLTSRISQRENKPSGISRTPMRGAAPAGAQIE